MFTGRSNCGFTLREVAIALLLMLVMTGVVVQRVADHSSDASVAACKRNVAAINQTIEKWYFDKGRWPADDLSDIRRDRSYFPNGIPRCPVTRKLYTMSPRTHRVSCSCR